MHFYWEKFRSLRKQNHISVNYIANKLDISPVAIWRWERGKRKPDENSIRKLSKLTGFPLAIISDLTDEIPVTRLRTEELNSRIVGPVFFEENNLLEVYDSISNTAIKLKQKLMEISTLQKALINSSNIMFYVKDNNLKYLAINDIFLKTLCLQSNYEYSGKTDEAIFSLKEARENTKEDEMVLISGTPVINKEGVLPGSRQKKWSLISKYPIFDSENHACGIVGIFIDITDRHFNEQKRLLLEYAIDNLSVGVSIIPEKEYLSKGKWFINKAYTGITGLSMAYIIGHSDLMNIVHPDYIEGVKEFFNSKKYPKIHEFKIIREQDKKVLFVRLIMEKTGTFIISLFNDITEELENKGIRELLEIHTKATNKAVTIINLDTQKYEYVSEMRKEIYGRSPEDFYKHSIDYWLCECVYPEDREYASGILNMLVEQRKKKPVMEIRICRPNGEIRWVRKETSFITFRNCHCAMHIETDITEQKKDSEIKELLKIYTELFHKAIAIIDIKNGKYLYINEAHEKLYGRKIEEYAGGLKFWFNECLYSKDKRLFRDYTDDEAEFDIKHPMMQYRIKRPDGEIIHVSSNARIIEFKGRHCGIYVEEEINS